MCNAKGFIFAEFSVEKTIRNILSKVALCCDLLIENYSEKSVLIPNNENEIRDLLHYNYLNENKIRDKFNLKEYLFLPEVPEITEKDGIRGRTDIRVLIKSRSFENVNEYFTIECKRVDGGSDLNKKYINNGISRFVDDNQPLYLSYFGFNSMIGFVVNDIDITQNIKEINNLIDTEFKHVSCKNPLEFEAGIKHCSFIFSSSHESQKKQLKLYHLMIDFSSIIEN